MTYTPVTVTLNNFVFDGATESPSGVVWDWQELSGWFDTGDLRTATGEAGRGVILTVARRIGRPITATVLAHAAADGMRLDDLMYTAQRALKAAVAAAVSEAAVLLKVNEPSLALQSRVRQVGPIRSKMLGTRAMVQFQVPLLAPDYRRYSQTLNSQALTVGSNVVTNAGDLPAPVTLTRTGATTDPSWQNTTAAGDPTLAYTGTFGAVTLTISTDTENVLLNGVTSRSSLTTAQWWNLAPGANTIIASHTSTIEWRDAYS